jgi:hypothetical protein
MGSRVDQVFDAMKAYLEPAVEAAIDERNESDPTLHLNHIAEWDRGYRDILTGIREYPAMLFLEKRRYGKSSFFTTYEMVIGFAYMNPDADEMQRQTDAYRDILEDVVRADWHMGESTLDVSGFDMDSDTIGGVFVSAIDVDIDVDNGGFV